MSSLDVPASALPEVTIRGVIQKKSSSPFVGFRPRFGAVSGQSLVTYKAESVSARGRARILHVT
jgi:hypothetical protein